MRHILAAFRYSTVPLTSGALGAAPALRRRERSNQRSLLTPRLSGSLALKGARTGGSAKKAIKGLRSIGSSGRSAGAAFFFLHVEENADKSVFVVTRERHSPPKATITPTEAPEGEGGEIDEGEPENGAQGATEPPKTKQSLRKYVCPKCGCIIRASRGGNVICGECKVPFEQET